MVTANTGSATITIIDTETDKLVKDLPCSVGCHGANFGAKKDGGYYAYVTSSFSNDLIVVDGDPNNDGDPSDAEIAGRISLVGSPKTQVDDKVNALPGTGGMGITTYTYCLQWMGSKPPRGVENQTDGGTAKSIINNFLYELQFSRD